MASAISHQDWRRHTWRSSARIRLHGQTSHWIQRLLVCNAATPPRAPRPPAKGDPFTHPRGRMHLRKVLSAFITYLVCKRPSQNGAATPQAGRPLRDGPRGQGTKPPQADAPSTGPRCIKATPRQTDAAGHHSHMRAQKAPCSHILKQGPGNPFQGRWQDGETAPRREDKSIW